MSEDWDVSEEEMDAWLEDYEAVDREAAEYLAERVPTLDEPLGDVDDRRITHLAGTIAPEDEPDPSDVDIEPLSAVMALQHADWLGMALGAVRRGPGSELDAELVLDDIDALDEIEGDVDDRDGTLSVLSMAIHHLMPQWQELGVLDDEGRFTTSGVRDLPRALHRIWTS